MKKLAVLLVTGLLALPAQAQLFSREAAGGAALGGLVGGIIGHNHGRRTGEGIAIGAGAGLLLGALTHEARRDRVAYYEYGPYSPPPVYGHYYSPHYYPARPHPAVTGAALGGIAGGIIGHNRGRRTAEGIAIGAGAGLILGAIAENESRRRAYYPYGYPAPGYRVVSVPATTVVTVPVQTPPPQQITTVHNHYYNTPSPSSMNSANGLFGR